MFKCLTVLLNAINVVKHTNEVRNCGNSGTHLCSLGVCFFVPQLMSRLFTCIRLMDHSFYHRLFEIRTHVPVLFVILQVCTSLGLNYAKDSLSYLFFIISVCGNYRYIIQVLGLDVVP